jgi:hypothetical protein
MGFNADALVFTLNENGSSSDVLVTAISMSDLTAGNPITPRQTDVSGFSIRPTCMHDSVAGDPMWLIESTAGSDNKISVIRMDNVLSASPTFTTTSLSVNPYLGTVQPLQPDGTGLAPSSGNGALWTHILKAGEFNNTIVACDQVSVSSTEDDARWYQIDVSGATPTLADQGNVSAGDNTYVVFPSIDINAQGDIGMTYLQSGTGTGQFMSMYITGRVPSDAAGTMETSVLVQAGAANSTDGREGDLSGINVDTTPIAVTAAANQSAVEGASKALDLGSFADSEGNFWAANEFAATGGSWGTSIGQFTLGQGPWNVDVNWGDGTPHATFSTSTVGSLGTLSHTFAEERTYTVTVTVTNTATSHSDSKTYQVTVSDPAVTPTGGFSLTTARGAPLCDVTVATFIDPGGAEPNPSDPSGVHYTADIDWGDGTPSSAGEIGFSGSPGSKTDAFTITGDHTYVGNGTYTIKITIHHESATDVMTTSTATVKSIAIGQGPCDSNTLLIGGTLGADKIRVTPQSSSGDVQVLINSEPAVIVSASSFSSIAIYAQAGDDDVQVDSSVNRTVFEFGGDGNDRLKGGGGNSLLVGGAGNDKLTGSSTLSVLIGGAGADTITAQGTGDLVIAGLVDFDDPTNCDNNPKLCDLLHAWADPTHTYNQRAAAVAALLAGHVSNDGAVDTLNGGPGLDLFYLSAGDVLKGNQKGEIIVTI